MKIWLDLDPARNAKKNPKNFSSLCVRAPYVLASSVKVRQSVRHMPSWGRVQVHLNPTSSLRVAHTVLTFTAHARNTYGAHTHLTYPKYGNNYLYMAHAKAWSSQKHDARKYTTLCLPLATHIRTYGARCSRSGSSALPSLESGFKPA